MIVPDFLYQGSFDNYNDYPIGGYNGMVCAECGRRISDNEIYGHNPETNEEFCKRHLLAFLYNEYVYGGTFKDFKEVIKNNGF